jgi:hypothetical protein
MSDFLLRTLMAAIISIFGVVATQMWSKSNQVHIGPQDAKPVAEIKIITNEVQRRPANRLIWQHVYAGQELYPGEAIRTAGDAEAEIEFKKQKVTVRLDPYSVIEIQESQEGLNLDFLKGNLFIVSQSESSNLTVGSGGQTMALGQSEVQLSKAKPTEQMSVDVFKGQPKLIKEGHEQAFIEEKKLKVLHPKPDEVSFVKPDSEEPVTFEWQAIDSAYEVTLAIGKSRDELKSVVIDKASGASGKLLAKLPLGKGYYQLVARSTRGDLKELKSSPTRFEVRAKIPPVLLWPTVNALVIPDKNDQSISFQWSNPGDLENLLLEVASTKDFKKKIYSEELGGNVSMKMPAFNPSGAMYWRVSGKLPGTEMVISSVVQQFFLRNRGKNLLTPPVLKSPVNQYTVQFEEMRNSGVTLTWNPVPDAKSYNFSLSKVGAEKVAQQTQESKTPNLTIRDLKPGKYIWFATALDEFGDASAPSEQWSFTVDGVPTLAWSDGLLNAKTTYKALKPLAKLSWNRGPANAKSWRVRMSTTREPASDDGWIAVPNPYFEARPDLDGTYYFEAEALDEAGTVVGRAPVRTQEFVQAAAPLAPEFSDSTPDSIEARDDGSLDIAWTPVADAKDYSIILKDEAGTVVKTATTNALRGSFSKLKPGKFTITLQAHDSVGRASPESAPRPLFVPEYSDVQAPTLRTINVK